MRHNFASIREVGLEVPLNFSNLNFRVFKTSDGVYHLGDHKGSVSARRHFLEVGSEEAFEKIGACCDIKPEWSYIDSGGFPRGITAANLMQLRKSILEIPKETKMLEVDKANSKKIYGSLFKLMGPTDISISAQLISTAGRSTSWRNEYEYIKTFEMSKRVNLFHKADPKPFFKAFLQNNFPSPPSSGIDLEINKKMRAVFREALTKLTETEDSYLVALTPLKPYWHPVELGVILELYPSRGRDLHILPAAVAEGLNRLELVESSFKLPEPIDERTLEAVKVLYDPQAPDGAYSTLGPAYKAAKQL